MTDELVAFEDGAGLQSGKVGTGDRLGKALAPDLFARKNLVDVAPLLILGAVLKDRRGAHRKPQLVERSGRAYPRHLLIEDGRLDNRQALAAVFLRPRKPEIAGLIEPPLPIAQGLDGLLVDRKRKAAIGEIARLIGGRAMRAPWREKRLLREYRSNSSIDYRSYIRCASMLIGARIAGRAQAPISTPIWSKVVERGYLPGRYSARCEANLPALHLLHQ